MTKCQAGCQRQVLIFNAKPEYMMAKVSLTEGWGVKCAIVRWHLSKALLGAGDLRVATMAALSEVL